MKPAIRTSLAFLLLAGGSLGAVHAAEDVMVVYDASGSMWGQIDGVSKIEIARNVMAGLVNAWPADTNLGLVAFGHRRQGDCGDIETIIEPQPISPATYLDAVNAITPHGRTPLSAAVEHAAEALAYRDNPATVVLISDGIENCQADPCALAAQLAQQGVAFTTHVIGFDIASDDHEKLACIAENTGGIFVPADDAQQLAAAVAQVQSVIEAQPEPEPAPEPEPDPAIEVSVKAPHTVTVGARFTVGWTPTIAANDYLTIVEAGAREGSYGNYARARDHDEVELTAPSEVGVYEVRYVLDQDGRTMGTAYVEVIESVVILSAPEQVETGARFDVSWAQSVNSNDYITIVDVSAREGSYGNYIRVRDDSEGTLTAPAEPGLYEVRYVLAEGGVTQAGVLVQVTDAEQAVSGPEQVTTGSRFPISWSRAINPNDYVTIVALGAAEGSYGNYIRVRDSSEGELTAPPETGLYELRYVLAEGGRTMASAPIEVTAAEVTVSAPGQAAAGSRIAVSWSGTVNANDYVTIVSMGANEGSYGNYARVRSDTQGELVAPSEPGFYEVRYVLAEGGVTLASAPLELIDSEVIVTGPGTVRAGTQISVSWSNTVNSNDYVAVVPAGSESGSLGASYKRVRSDTQATFTAPDEPGFYEVRYVLDAGRRLIASDTFEVVAADAPLDEGAGLSAPSSAAPGASVTVTWTGDAENARVSLARADQADFSWIEAQPANAEKATKFTMPDAPGSYEFRFLDIGNQAVLGRSIIEVQ
ncbi:VWA domain-containing protein [Pelagibacterium lentulum]|uniref:VWFA domain-containing protein n=1 Tax=Pelagibacterium lentulum TaxID=2029865 RepID=A0A916VXE8_9HYPH|nr:VWA domain-containing protein [Pelagibacterium lentulum]GGA50795.1 hypothetical protein GCM10011499_21000 [Pelagibacterium lentulum]